MLLPRLQPGDGSRAPGIALGCPAALPCPCPRAPYNQEKNRYGDVPCLDQTRVKLAKPYSRPEVSPPRILHCSTSPSLTPSTWVLAHFACLELSPGVMLKSSPWCTHVMSLSAADRLHQRQLHGWLQAEERVHRDTG